MNVTIIVLGIMLMILSFSCGIVLIYYWSKFNEWKHDIAFRKRRGNIVKIYTFCSIAILLIGEPLMLLLHFNWKLISKSDSTPYMFLEVLNDLLYLPFFYFGTGFSLLRYWLIYFDIQFVSSCLNIEWKQIINKNIETLQEQWYIYYRNTIGNQSYMSRRVAIVCTIVSISSLTFNYIYVFQITATKLWIALNAIFFVTLVSSVVIIFCRMPPFKDTIFLYKEFKAISFCWCISLFLYFTAVILGIIFGDDMMIKFMEFIGSTTGAVVVPLTSTFWVLRQLQFTAIVRNLHYEMSNGTRQKHNDLKAKTLREILKDNDVIDAFMQHLIEELSMECLLALIELHQFKLHCVDVFNIDCTVGKHLHVSIELADTIPKSDIVFNGNDHENDLLSFKCKAYKLYMKYIICETQFEINIRHDARNKYDTLMVDYDKWINNNDVDQLFLFSIFDEVIKDMMLLLGFSRTRFVSNLNNEHIKI
eukprot:131602_1